MGNARVEKLVEFIKPFQVKPGRRVDLEKDFFPGDTDDFLNKKSAGKFLEDNIELLSEYQERLAAQSIYGVLVILQALDAGGKDGIVRHVMSGVNPAGVSVRSFKVPSVEELDHDYLWRYAQRLPARGDITIFNRSYYEEVLVVRVHPELLERQNLPPGGKESGIWKQRYREINTWERYLVENGIHVVKLLLNLSKDEQRERFLARIDEPDKNWKFSAADARERLHWDEYQEAFSEMLSHTSTKWAPWYVLPADHKWFTRAVASAVIVNCLAKLNPEFPVVADKEARAELLKVKAELEDEIAAEKGKK